MPAPSWPVSGRWPVTADEWVRYWVVLATLVVAAVVLWRVRSSG